MRLDFEFVGTITNLDFCVRLLNLWELSRIWIFAIRLLNCGNSYEFRFFR
ncbi:hypothetical protein LEP1GSC074_2767 [Leptospira noguchii str. Hook]|nr:hypothetical protein LEP1GSC074_2767 [Leptospira noguchii str. Hook]